jgi:hypothetical protein
MIVAEEAKEPSWQDMQFFDMASMPKEESIMTYLDRKWASPSAALCPERDAPNAVWHILQKAFPASWRLR